MFEKLVVLELANVLAGPAVGMFFAELGATVIKVENPLTGGDVTRGWRLRSEPFDSDVSTYFSSVNWGKRSIAINATLPSGQRTLHHLVTQSDIVLASYKPGDDHKLGMDYRVLSELNPALIYARVTGYGMSDTRAGFDAILQAACGFTYMNGQPDGPPTKMPVALIDLLAGHQLKEAILLALLRRAETGKGDCLHVSLFDAGLASLANQAANWLVAGAIPQRMGSAHPNIAPYGTVYDTRDDHAIVLGVGNDVQFELLCDVLRCPDVALDARFASNARRVRHCAALDDILAHHILQFDRDPLLAALDAHRVPAGPIAICRRSFRCRTARRWWSPGT